MARKILKILICFIVINKTSFAYKYTFISEALLFRMEKNPLSLTLFFLLFAHHCLLLFLHLLKSGHET